MIIGSLAVLWLVLILILALLGKTVVATVGFWGFNFLWLLALTLLTAGLYSISGLTVKRYIQYYRGQLASNNNYRWLLLVWLAGCFFIEWSFVRLGVNTWAEHALQEQKVRSAISVGKVFEEFAHLPLDKAHQAMVETIPLLDWTWFAMWCITALLIIPYTPYAFWDEVAEAWRQSRHRVEQSRRVSRNARDAARPVLSGSNTRDWGYLKDVSANFLVEGTFEAFRMLSQRYRR